jgi:Cu+-exporting ATPase
VLRLAASLDQGSEHPLADAIVSAARAKGLELIKPLISSPAAASACAARSIGSLVLGNTALMQQEGVATDALKIDGERLRSEGASVMHLAVDRQLAGILAVTDPSRPPR